MQPAPSDVSAPLADLSHARLELPGGAYHLTLRPADGRAHTGGDPYREPPELFRAHFEGAPPQVVVQDGTVRIQYPRFKFFGRSSVSGEIALAPSVPWSIALSGGAAHVNADLRKLKLEGIAITGGMSVVRLLLGRPTGRVTIVITGGVHRLELLRPAVVPLRVHATGGIHDLRIDELQLGALGGRFDWETPELNTAADLYDITLSGGASGLAIGRDGELALPATGEPIAEAHAG